MNKKYGSLRKLITNILLPGGQAEPIKIETALCYLSAAYCMITSDFTAVVSTGAAIMTPGVGAGVVNIAFAECNMNPAQEEEMIYI